MTAMECDRVEARHPAARLVFDDDASEVVTLTPSDDEEARASAREGPRVLTVAMDVDDARAGDVVKPSATTRTTTTTTTTTMFARLKMHLWVISWEPPRDDDAQARPGGVAGGQGEQTQSRGRWTRIGRVENRARDRADVG